MSSRYLIVAGKFNDTITKLLVAGAQETLHEAGVADHAVQVVWVPGSFEIPVVAANPAALTRALTFP